MSADVSLKVATKGFFQGNKPWKFSIFEAIFLKQKQSNKNPKKIISVYLKRFMPGSDTYFLKVSAVVSLKVLIKDSFRR